MLKRNQNCFVNLEKRRQVKECIERLNTACGDTEKYFFQYLDIYGEPCAIVFLGGNFRVEIRGLGEETESAVSLLFQSNEDVENRLLIRDCPNDYYLIYSTISFGTQIVEHPAHTEDLTYSEMKDEIKRLAVN